MGPDHTRDTVPVAGSAPALHRLGAAGAPGASEACQAVAPVLARVGDKWSVLIVRALGPGPRRFNDIKRDVGGIWPRMLSLVLRGLERDGLVRRTVFPPCRRASTTL